MGVAAHTLAIADIISLFLAFCGGISILGAAVCYIGKAVGWIRKPEVQKSIMLEDHEKRISKLEELTEKDYEEIKTLEKEVKMLLKATLAIMKHDVDGNNTEELKRTQKDIESYLLDK